MTNTIHIRHRGTGEFYQGLDHGYGPGYSSRTAKSNPEYATKGWGKAFKDIGKVKTHLLYLVGIMRPPQEYWDLEEKRHDIISRGGRGAFSSPEYQRINDEIEAWHEIHPGYRNIPEWLDNPHPLDSIPQDWEVVEVTDKRNKIWTVLDLNPAAYADEALRLRRLTDAHGSAVRDVYKKLEKAGKMDQLPWVVAVTLDLATIDQKSHNWWEGAKVDPLAVDEMIQRMGTKRGDMVRTTKKESIAIAFRSDSDAFWFKLGYDGIDRVTVLDIKNLVEVAEKPV